MKNCFVVGADRFGVAMAAALREQGLEILLVDDREERLLPMKDRVSGAVTCDFREEAVLTALAAGSYDCAVLSLEEDFGAAVLTAMSLRAMGVDRILCTAGDERQKRALLQAGADWVVDPDQIGGAEAARLLLEQEGRA